MTVATGHGVLPGNWTGTVVLVAGVSWEGNRLGAQHIAERLTRYAPVLYVDPPRTPMTVLRNPWLRQSQREPRLRLISSRLARLTPTVPPFKTRPVGRNLAAAAMRRQLATAVHQLGATVHAVVAVPPHFPMFGVVGERLAVHLASDDFVAGAGLNGVSPRWAARREEQIARSADRVVAVSLVIQEKWRRLGHDADLMTNGCDYDLFSATDGVSPAPDVHLPRPVAGFIGTLSERTDVSWLEAIADRGHSLLLVGPRSRLAPHERLDRLGARPNVQWVGRQAHTAVPAYLKHVDVGLVPYLDDEFNRASFPLKVLDYLSTGLPVVSSDLPAVRWLDTELITSVRSRQGFADAVTSALTVPTTAADVARRRRFAATHSWDARVAQLAEVLGLLFGDAATPGAGPHT